jgi:hypothetical protein
MNTDLSNLKIGDRVVVRGGIGGERFTITTIARMTATQFVTTSGDKYRRSDGAIIGGDKWSTYRLDTSQEAFTRAKEQHAARVLHHGFSFTRAGVKAAREAADYAERLLKFTGKWEGAPE